MGINAVKTAYTLLTKAELAAKMNAVAASTQTVKVMGRKARQAYPVG